MASPRNPHAPPDTTLEVHRRVGIYKIYAPIAIVVETGITHRNWSVGPANRRLCGVFSNRRPCTRSTVEFVDRDNQELRWTRAPAPAAQWRRLIDASLNLTTSRSIVARNVTTDGQPVTRPELDAVVSISLLSHSKITQVCENDVVSGSRSESIPSRWANLKL